MARWLFPVPGGTQEVHDLAAGDEAQLGECQDAIAVERGLEREVEAAERLDGGKAPHAQRCLDPAVLAQGQLLGEQDVDGLECADLGVLQAAYDLIERFQGAWHLQADQVAADAIEHRRGQFRDPAHARRCASRRPTAS